MGLGTHFRTVTGRRKYLVDSDGYIRYDHIGEGGYVETENAIKNLLSERSNQQSIEISNINQTKLIKPGRNLILTQSRHQNYTLVTNTQEPTWKYRRIQSR